MQTLAHSISPIPVSDCFLYTAEWYRTCSLMLQLGSTHWGLSRTLVSRHLEPGVFWPRIIWRSPMSFGTGASRPLLRLASFMAMALLVPLSHASVLGNGNSVPPSPLFPTGTL